MPAFAIGTIIATAIIGDLVVATWVIPALAFAINMVASAIISKALAPDTPNGNNAGYTPNPGNRQQVPPAGDNKLPIIYGTAWVGGIVTDMSISSNNQDVYWVLALSEVTNTESGGTPDTITFGDIYWGGKKVIFSTTAGQTYKVTGLYDPSTAAIQDVTGYMDIWLYRNGSNNPVNSTSAAYTVLSDPSLVYQWTAAKTMSNCAFAIIHIHYSQSRNLTSMNQTRFKITNSRSAPGDCFLDYFTSERYGAAIPLSQVDTASLTALNTYSAQNISYNLYSGGVSTQQRYVFNGSLDTNVRVMNNIQSMADSCNCLIKYNEITSQWGVIVQQPTNTIVMDINDSNMVSAITITPIDISSTFNIIECKYPDSSNQDAFSSVSFDLSVIDPSLLFPNEPVNKQSLNLYMVNNSVTAQYISNILLKAAREDLQLMVEVNYVGIQLEAGDIVTVTNSNYGWVAKQFRIAKVVEKFSDTGQVTASLNLMEFNASVYSDMSITEFTPAPNSGLGNPGIFGIVPAPTITTALPSAVNPAFNVNVTSSSAGITQYAEVWYSAYQFPTSAQMFFAGTTAIQADGNPYGQSVAMPPVQLFNIPAGNWYFFSRMVNNLASSNYSLASSVFNWRPTTFQFSDRYLAIAYGDDLIGTGFNLSPRGKSYFGIVNQTTTTPPSTAASYTWYLADPTFGTNIYLAYINYGNRKFGFDTDFATYAAGTGAFVPSTASQFDPRLWAALPDGTNYIDLDHSTGQVTQTGTTTVGTGQVQIVNTNNGQMVAALQQFLDFGGNPTYTGSAANITIDIYGRVVGFTAPDNMYFSFQNFTATAGQTIFTPTARVAGYITGQDLIFRNGALLDTTDYSETSTTFTLAVGATVGDIVSVLSFRAVSSGNYYENTFLTVQTTATNTVTYNSSQLPYQLFNVGDIITFANTGTPTQYTISSVNYTTRVITVGTTISGVAAGATIYRYRAATSSYPVFSRWSFDLTSASTYTPTTWSFDSGYELLFLNGTIVNEQDYDIVSGVLTNFPAATTGKFNAIQWSGNNLGTPTGTPANVVAFTTTGITTYSFSYASAAGFNLYANGLYLDQGVDYSTATNTYTLSNSPTNSSTVLVQETFARVSAA
ncbi:hypothetical protein UFOVP17_28 [uncultured Caudovirales phage]|uniref:Tip attachment protein J n=1 Tax=uncultured Caudovirales phage TaxID=2100421 RepID=A0A6J5KLX2_9CAUD|nr:hypothetical protein UFOVP17_28 [uncultured Caudovirales phage]